MKNITVRIIALGLSVVIIFGLAFLFLGVPEGSKNANGVVASTVMIEMEEGYSVTAEEYFYYALNSRVNYEAQNGEGIFEAYPILGEEMLAQIDELLINSNAYLMWGAEEGFELTDEDKAEFDIQLEQLKTQLKEYNKNVNEYFRENNLTTDLFRRIYLRDVYIEKFLSEYLTPMHPTLAVTEAEITEYISRKGVLAAKHILIMSDGDDPEEKRAAAEDILAKIESGGDFDSLMLAMTEDTGIASYPDGYTFEPGEFMQEFEDAVKELKQGEISGIVETDYGYHIIKRIAVDRTAVKLKVQQEVFARKSNEYIERLNPRNTFEREQLDIVEMYPVI